MGLLNYNTDMSIASPSTPICDQNQESSTYFVLYHDPPNQNRSDVFYDFGGLFLILSFFRLRYLTNLVLVCFHQLGCFTDRSTLKFRFVVDAIRYNFSARFRGLLFCFVGLGYFLIIHNFSTNLRGLSMDLNHSYVKYLILPPDAILWVVVYVIMFATLIGDVMKIWCKFGILSDLLQKYVPPAATSMAATQALETKTATICSSRLPASSSITTIVTTSSMPRQSDSFRFRLLKTDSDYHCY